MISHELYERHYDINQENEEVETDEQLNLDEEVDLDDTPTSPAADLNTVNSIGIEAPTPVGTTRPLIIPTRGKTKVQRSLKSHVWKFCYLNGEKTFSICNVCKQHFKYTSGGTGGSTGD